MEQKRGAGKFLEILNSKPVIGILIFIMLSLVTVFAGNVVVKEGNLNVSDRIYDKTGFVTPIGSINAYGGSAAPSGWLLCDGSAVSRTTYTDLFAAIGTTFGTGDGSTTFNLPDMRGIFPRGAGTSGKLSNANGTAFAGTLGTYQNDSMQGHYHQFNAYHAEHQRQSGGEFVDEVANNPTDYNPTARVKIAITDGTNGGPRTGVETRPANLALSYIIKY